MSWDGHHTAVPTKHGADFSSPLRLTISLRLRNVVDPACVMV
jgi:hypothetical protein